MPLSSSFCAGTQSVILLVLAVLSAAPVAVSAQGHGFEFGRVTYSDLNTKAYGQDTSAVAVVLDEFGEAYFNSDNKLIFEYHVKTRILRTNGLEKANITIPLWKFDYNGEILTDVEAASYALTPSGIKEYSLDRRNIFTEEINEHLSVKKFAIPNVQVGNVIEVSYRIQSPYIFNFRKWEFQSDIPKIHSEYWALIPANYVYNIALKGFLALDVQDAERKRECFNLGGNKADCSLMKFAMDSIPAFVEEDYMTAPVNFVSSVNFELAEIKYFSGMSDKITKEWRDVEEELRRHKSFGVQLKRGRDILDNAAGTAAMREKDPLEKARLIYDFVKGHYAWNGKCSKYCDDGLKKVFAGGSGDAGDINLSLIAALRYAGLDANPLILSTRDNGFVTELYPVMSDFNYVVAMLSIKDKVYLLDATDDFLPFGVLPIRCLNGKGRVIGDRKTSWYEIEAPERIQQSSYISLLLDEEGTLKGTLSNTYTGYAAIDRRKKIYDFNSVEEYTKDIERKLKVTSVTHHEIRHLDELDEPLIETMEITVERMDDPGNTFLFNPFLINKWNRNPFRASERLYPVDFGAPIEERIILNLELPENIDVLNVPENIGLALPNEGGKYILAVQRKPRKLAISSRLTISRILYTSGEYHYLKELFNQIVQAQNTDIIFKKK